jgi:hypothetical protein
MKSVATFIATLLILCGSPQIYSQFLLDVDSFDNSAFPQVSLQVTGRDAGRILRNLDASNYQLWEDGFKQDVSLQCDTGTELFRISFIIGNGLGMNDGNVNFARATVQSFLDQFNNQTDEGSISLYSTPSPSAQPYTSLVATLEGSIASGFLVSNNEQNALYKILISAAAETPPNGCIILFTNGQDDVGGVTQQQAVTAVLNKGIPLYLFPYAANPPSWLVDLANNSGGFVSTTHTYPTEDIIDILRGTPPYCVLSYESDNHCRDGNARDIKVRLKVASDSVDQTASMPLSADPASNVAVTLKFDDATATSGVSSKVDVLLQTSVSNQVFYSGSISLAYDPAMLDLTGVDGAGALASGSTFNFSKTPTGADITFTGMSQLDGSGALFSLDFLPVNVQTETTVPVLIGAVTMVRGCLDISTEDGSVMIQPKAADIAVTRSFPVLIFTWDDTQKKYTPEIAAYSVNVQNSGDLPVSGLEATLTVPEQLKIAAFSSATVDVDPTSLDKDKYGTATWYFKPVPQSKDVTVEVTASAKSAEGASDQQSYNVIIRAATQGLQMACSIDPVNVTGGAYTPKPVDARVRLTGVGTVGGAAANVELIFPNGSPLALASGNASQSSPALADAVTHNLSWPIDYPESSTEAQYDMMFVLSGAGVTPDTCTVTLIVPALTTSSLMYSCSLGVDTVKYDKATNSYLPNPFTVTAMVKNNGTTESDTITAELIGLGPEMTLMSPALQVVSTALAANDSAEVNWQIELEVECDTRTETLNIRFISGVDTIDCSSTIVIEGSNTGPPVILSRTPVTIDSVQQGRPMTFTVDAEGDGDLTYTWLIGSNTVGTDTSSFTTSFSTTQTRRVTCYVMDACGDTISTWWDVRVVTDLESTPEAIHGFAIVGNYPNPFNPSTVIEYRVPEGAHRIKLELLNASGQLVSTLVDGSMQGGIQRYSLQADGLPSGNYVVRLISSDVVVTRSIMLVK